MSKGSGNGKTPKRVRELFLSEIKERGVRGTAASIGVTASAVHRYAQGIGEPTTATLRKLAVYFNVPLSSLRDPDYSEESNVAGRVLWNYADNNELIGENGENPLEEFNGLVMEFLKIPLEKMDLAKDILDQVQLEWKDRKEEAK